MKTNLTTGWSASGVQNQLGWMVVNGYIRHDATQPGLIRIAPEGVA